MAMDPRNELDVVENTLLNITLSSSDLASHDDIFTEILLRLPVRSLTRFKSVSKHLHCLISSSRFALLRNPKPTSPSGVFILQSASPNYEFVPFDLENPVKPPFKTLQFNDGVSRIRGELILQSSCSLMQSSCGLMLCESSRGNIIYKYYVFNPTINQRIELPAFDDSDCFEIRVSGMTLAFDPLVSPHYKVICVRRYLLPNESDKYRIEVYSSENERWKVSSKHVSISSCTELMSGVFWNDTLHWINSRGFVLYQKIYDGELIQHRENIKGIRTPRQYRNWKVKRHCPPLVKSRKSLLFIDILPSHTTNIVVYEMITDYSGWEIKYHVDISSLISFLPEYYSCRRRVLDYLIVHCFVLGERDEDSFLVLDFLKRIIRFNLISRASQKLCDFDSFNIPDTNTHPWPCAFLFAESLRHV